MISITAQAAAKLSEIIKQQDDPATRLRLFITKGGCHEIGRASCRERV